MLQPILFNSSTTQGTTLGQELVAFYDRQEMQPEPRHIQLDVYCVLLRCSQTPKDEIAVHWCLLGNGALSFEGLCCMALTIFFPRSLPFFRIAYRKGKAAHLFHSLDFSKMLEQPLQGLRDGLALQPLHP